MKKERSRQTIKTVIIRPKKKRGGQIKYKTDAERKAAIREQSRKHYEKNKKEINRRAMERYHANKELRLKQSREWDKNNPKARRKIAKRSYEKRLQKIYSFMKGEFSIPALDVITADIATLKKQIAECLELKADIVDLCSDIAGLQKKLRTY